MPISGSQKALTYSFSGIMRAGAGRSGYFPAIAAFNIGGATIGSAVKPSAIITDELDAVPNTARLSVRGGPSYAAEVLADSPSGYWKLDEMSGTTIAVDRSGNARNGTYVSTVTLSQSGALSDGSKAATFVAIGTGAGDTGGYATATIAALGTTWTLETWIKKNGAPAVAQVEFLTIATAIEVYIGAGETFIRVFDSAGRITGAVNVCDNAWHHVVLVCDGANTKLYVDGVQDGSTYAGTISITGTTLNMARNYAGGFTFNGSLDEVAVYATALSTGRITTHYAARLYTTSLLQSGSEIIIGLGNLTNRIFAGHILSYRQPPHHFRDQKRPLFELDCIDYSWQLDWKRVTGKSWTSTSVGTIVGDIITAFAPAFTVRTEAGLTSVDFQSNHDERVSEALSRLMKMIGGYWYVDYDRVVHVYVNPEPDGNAVALDSTNTKFWAFEYAEDISQARTRTRVTGGASTTTAVAAVGATSLAIDDTRLFASAGGYALVGGNQITYTGKSTTEGPGSLTGIPSAGTGSVLTSVAQGESVRVLAIQQSATSAAAMIAQVGTGDGYIEHTIEDGSLGDSAANQTASGDLLLNQTYDKRIAFRTRDLFMRSGKLVSVDQTNTKTNQHLTGSYKVQRVVISDIELSRTRYPVRTVEAGANRQNLFIILGDVLE
jgi:hypothetical protein